MLADLLPQLMASYCERPAMPRKRVYSVPRYSVSRKKWTPEEYAQRERIRKREYNRRVKANKK